MTFPARIRDILKIEKKNCMSISVVGYENKEKQPIYVLKTNWNTCWSIINTRKRKKALSFCQIFFTGF